jgi:hypothetical protein
MLLPVVPAGLDPAVVIPLSTEAEHKSTEPTIAFKSELATAVSQKIRLLQNVIKAKNSPCNLPNQINSHLLACLFQNPQPIRAVTTLKIILSVKILQSVE